MFETQRPTLSTGAVTEKYILVLISSIVNALMAKPVNIAPNAGTVPVPVTFDVRISDLMKR